MTQTKKKLTPGVKRVSKRRGPGKPDFVVGNVGWMAKFQAADDPDEVELVHFPLWSIWFEDSGKPIGAQPLMPVDPLGKRWEYGENIENYMGFEEPDDGVEDLLGAGLDDDDSDDDDDDDSDDDDGGDDDDEPEDDDDAPAPEVIDTDGRPVGDVPPAGRASG